jgi:flagella basal body P-ring formation protein FlgA
MELIIDFDKIKDPGKKEWLLRTLKLMGIAFQATETPQTIAQYNEDLAAGNAEIERGDMITAEDLKIEARKW